MPAVPVYSASPVNAAKASGTTPQTAQEGHQATAGYSASTTSTAASASAASQQQYPAPQPAAAPSLPAPTAALQSLSNTYQPTPTQSLPQDSGPPAPQPGAAPVPVSSAASSHLPPPPKAGEKLQQPQITPAPTVPMPPQMSYPPPTSTYAMGSSTTTATGPFGGGGPAPTSIREGGLGDEYAHPPGYQQDVHASELSSNQRAAHNAAVIQDSNTFGTGGEDSVWDTAKKWANAAGNSLAAAENEVWKRINKE